MKLDSKNSSMEAKNFAFAHQFGGGLLPAIAAAGVVMVMTQGTLFYKAKTSNQFLAEEKSKIMAQQAAEAGVENSIADLGARRLIVTHDMHHYVAAENSEIGAGRFTTHLTTLAMGPDGDTVNLYSNGSFKNKAKNVTAKLRLHNAFDTNQVILSEATPDTAITVSTVTVMDTTYIETYVDPETLPLLDLTPAYTACMASAGPKCKICHLTSSDVKSSFVIDVAKPSIWKHVAHHGDYVTTDGTCDIYNPVLTPSYSSHTKLDTNMAITTHITYDTTTAIDTLVKVEVLSWR